MSAEIVTDAKSGNLTITVPSKWVEHVYSGKAIVSLSRGEPKRGTPDEIVRVDIEWLPDTPPISASTPEKESN